MKYFLYFLIFVFLALLILALVNGFVTVKLKAQTIPRAMITEIMYNPAGTDSGHEWLEIFNSSTSTIYNFDERWRFNDGSNHLLSVVQGGSSLATGTYAVIADNPALFLQDYSDYQGILLDSSFSLNNTSDTLSLSVDAGQSQFGEVIYQSAWGANNDGYTLSRVGLSDDWQPSVQINGTPGQINFPLSEEISEILVEEGATSTPEQIENIDQATTTLELIDGELASTTAAELNDSATTTVDDLGNFATTTNEDVNQNQTEQNQENIQAANNQNLSVNEPVYSDQIFINEILPNPSGSDSDEEFIELFNRSNEPVDLSGWQLKDNSAKRFTINALKYQSTVVPAYGYFVVYSRESGLALNNDGDAVNLYQPNGNLLSAISYFDQAVSAWSYAKNGAEFVWTFEPTPGQANIIKTREIASNSGSTVVYLNQPSQSAVSNQTTMAAQNVNYDLNKYRNLRINEILPDPVGSDSAEWLEIYNNFSENLALGGFKVDDAEGNSKPYVFGATSTINANQYLLVKKSVSKISLNNDEDSVRLLGPDDQVINEVSYEKARTGRSYNYDELNEEWFWSKELTPGQANALPLNDQSTIANALAEASNSSATESVINDFHFLKDLPKSEEVIVTGAITALPGQLYKKSFYLSAYDAITGSINFNDGLEIYSSDAGKLSFTIGDIIQLKGRVSFVQNRVRINLLKGEIPQVIGHLPLPQLINLGFDDLSDELTGALISFTGQVVKKQSNAVYLDDGSGEIRVDFKENVKSEYKNIKEGDWLTVAGILISASDGYRLLPRTAEDMKKAQVLGEVDELTNFSSQTIDIMPENRGAQAMKYLFYSGGGLITILVSLLVKLKFFS